VKMNSGARIVRAPPVGGRSGFETQPPHMEAVKRKPINKQLSDKFGGYWKHIPFQGMWICDELDAHACYVADGGYDINGNYIPVPSMFQRLTIYGLKDGIKYLYPR